MIKKIGVLTSGGDSPGMNTAIYNIVKTGIKNNFEIYGIYDGYKGLYNNKIKLLKYKKILNIHNKGGTILGSSRFPELKEYKIREKIIKNINKKIEALIVIGGEGSYIGAEKLMKMNLPCITIPGTIDNDIYGTDYTIGCFTALNTIVECIDKIEDTNLSHKRISIIEVMGKKCGFLALSSALASSCKYVIIPEIHFEEKKLINKVKKKINKGINNLIIIITENICNIHNISKKIEKYTKKETRAISLGHIQRGGNPSPMDRILAKRMGYFAIQLIKKKQFGYNIGIKNQKIIKYRFVDNKKNNINKINKEFIKII